MFCMSGRIMPNDDEWKATRATHFSADENTQPTEAVAEKKLLIDLMQPNKQIPFPSAERSHLSSATSSWSMTQQQHWLAQLDTTRQLDGGNEFVSIVCSPLCCWGNAPVFLWIINLHFCRLVAAFCEWERRMIERDCLASRIKVRHVSASSLYWREELIASFLGVFFFQ